LQDVAPPVTDVLCDQREEAVAQEACERHRHAQVFSRCKRETNINVTPHSTAARSVKTSECVAPGARREIRSPRRQSSERDVARPFQDEPSAVTSETNAGKDASVADVIAGTRRETRE